jgi:phosphate transport system protein
MTTPMPPHLEAALQQDIDLIRTKVLEMARLDERALSRVMDALIRRDRQIAYAVILQDQFIDELETELDKLCLEFILRHQPAAGHLRFVYAVSKIVKELERIGDYAESIGRQVLQLSSMELNIPLERFSELANQAIPMLHNAVRAFMDRNPDLARTTMANEPHVRQIRDSLSAEMVEWRHQDRLPLEALGPLVTVARRFERVMEQSMNICEEALYSVTGEYVKHKPRRGFSILFADDANTCVSLMAEGIANNFGFQHLSFTSGGTEAGVIDPQTIRFMEEKGIDISSYASKSVSKIPGRDGIQVVVVFNKEAEKIYPLLPPKILKLEWFVPDPSKTSGGPSEVRAAFEKTFDTLSNHIQDLAQAILDDHKDPSHETH